MHDDKKSKEPPAPSELPDYVDEPLEAPPFSAAWFAPWRRKLLLLGVILLPLLIWKIPAAYRGIKNWRADILIGQSEGAFAVGDTNEGLALMKQAFALAPSSPRCQHAVQIYNASVGDKEALGLLLASMRTDSLNNDELLGVAELEAHAGNLPIVREAMTHLSPSLTPEQSLHRTLIEAAVMAQEGSMAKAAEHCLASAATLGQKESPFLRTQGARYLLAENEPTARRRAVEILLAVAGEHTKSSLPAWGVLAHQVLSQPTKPGDAEQLAEHQALITLLPTLPGSSVSDRLLAADLEIQADPARQQAVVESLTQRYAHAPRSESLEFARWLNTRGLFREAIALAAGPNGEEKHPGDADWLIVLMDARSAQGDWNKVTEMLKTTASEEIPDAVRHLFLARIALNNGDQASADSEWRSLNGDLSLEKNETLAYLANYEERIGAVDQAARVYREMINRKETKTIGLEALIRYQLHTDTLASLIPLYEQLLAASPDYPDAVADLAYLNLLLDREIIPSAAKAENLLQEQPNLLARISVAALGRLRRGDPKSALSLYENREIDWSASLNRWKAVRSAVLRASGDTQEADRFASTIDTTRLRPEELELLKKQR